MIIDKIPTLNTTGCHTDRQVWVGRCQVKCVIDKLKTIIIGRCVVLHFIAGCYPQDNVSVSRSHQPTTILGNSSVNETS